MNEDHTANFRAFIGDYAEYNMKKHVTYYSKYNTLCDTLTDRKMFEVIFVKFNDIYSNNKILIH